MTRRTQDQPKSRWANTFPSPQLWALVPHLSTVGLKSLPGKTRQEPRIVLGSQQVADSSALAQWSRSCREGREGTKAQGKGAQAGRQIPLPLLGIRSPAHPASST